MFQAGRGKEWVEQAANEQICRRGGFWEMRRYLGQFDGLAEDIANSGADQIVCAGVSGGVIGEYLNMRISEKAGKILPVDHMVFSRAGKGVPARGWLPTGFGLVGNRILLVEDMVVEMRTVDMMIKTLGEKYPDQNLEYYLMALEVQPGDSVAEKLGRMIRGVFCFEE
jgi:hypothetical protein